MPEITAETPRTTITIADNSFTVPQPYSEGHVLNANEASALNQTYAENVRNNQAKAIKEAIAAGTFNLEVFQGKVDDYTSGYEFGVRTGGGRSGDPVMQEAMDIARDLVRKAIVKAGKALKDYTAANISTLARGVLDRNDEKAAKILATARQRVEESNGIDDVEIDSLDTVGAAAEPVADAPAGRKGRSAEAEA